MTVTRSACNLPRMDNFHTRVRARREELGLTQSDVAQSCKVTSQAVQQWEDEGDNGTVPRRAKRILLAKALKCTEQWLEFGQEDASASPESDALPTRQNAPSPEESRLLKTYRKLSREGRAAILGAITERFYREHPDAAIEEFARMGLLSNLDETGKRNGSENNPNKRVPKPGRKGNT